MIITRMITIIITTTTLPELQKQQRPVSFERGVDNRGEA
jgi:hypothetical protein